MPPRLIPRGQPPDRGHYQIDTTESPVVNHSVKPQRPVPVETQAPSNVQVQAQPLTPNNNVKVPVEVVERPNSVLFPQMLPRSPTNSLYTPDSPNVTVVQEGGMVRPYHEEEKPFEMSDFYKYSTKFRQKQMTGNNKANG